MAPRTSRIVPKMWTGEAFERRCLPFEHELRPGPPLVASGGTQPALLVSFGATALDAHMLSAEVVNKTQYAAPLGRYLYT